MWINWPLQYKGRQVDEAYGFLNQITKFENEGRGNGIDSQ